MHKGFRIEHRLWPMRERLRVRRTRKAEGLWYNKVGDKIWQHIHRGVSTYILRPSRREVAK